MTTPTDADRKAAEEIARHIGLDDDFAQPIGIDGIARIIAEHMAAEREYYSTRTESMAAQLNEASKAMVAVLSARSLPAGSVVFVPVPSLEEADVIEESGCFHSSDMYEPKHVAPNDKLYKRLTVGEDGTLKDSE